MRKPPLIATLLTLVSVIILCSLGTWQIKRLAWKTEIIDNLNAAYKNQTDPQTFTPQSLNEQQFAYGTVTGIARPDKAILLGPRTFNKKIGHHLIIPIIKDNKTYLINLGWTAHPLDTLPIRHIKNKSFTVTGLARAPEWNSFTPENRPDQNLWYKPDIAEIATIKNLPNPAPYIIYADHINYKLDAQFPKHERWHPKNDHAGYATFWFSMALALLAIFYLRFMHTKNK